MNYDYGKIQVSYPEVLHPSHLKYPNDYKYRVHFTEKDFGAKYINVLIEAGDFVCMSEGSYGEPPVYDVDIKEMIIVNPVMRCWGRGLKWAT
ncbi:hypothetical protein [Paenibacillus donghaensis]|uniref:Uncharacterized protein n=1 Tax=Paenibacillus donghaensis TaxID=414771 RepID=A0A2Z2KHK4_9BACL|nr:hypothetical protein [Paenibacillus donghaensis]ASA22660.1 hypothetical protein B9T62_18810 [Paenibacillus donghaensis]